MRRTWSKRKISLKKRLRYAHNEIEIDLFCVDRKGKKHGARTGIALLLSTASGTLEEPFVSIENFDARVAYTRGGEESSRDDDSEEMLATCIFASKESCCRKRRGGRREEEKRKKEKRSDRGCFFEIGRTSIPGYRGDARSSCWRAV